MGIKKHFWDGWVYFLLFPSLDFNNQKNIIHNHHYLQNHILCMCRQLHPLCSVKISGCCVLSNQIKGDQDVRRSSGNLHVPSKGLNSGPSETSGRLIILCMWKWACLCQTVSLTFRMENNSTCAQPTLWIKAKCLRVDESLRFYKMNCLQDKLGGLNFSKSRREGQII